MGASGQPMPRYDMAATERIKPAIKIPLLMNRCVLHGGNLWRVLAPKQELSIEFDQL
jgi:hypothetical protein